MSAYKLSPQSQIRIREIGSYTLKNHGVKQQKLYLNLLRTKIREAARSPFNGVNRTDIEKGFYSIKAGKHHIYYCIQTTHIDIIEILHESMDALRHL